MYMSQNAETMLVEVRGLKVSFGTPDNPVQAVDDVSLHVAPGETLAILGESGSGKSVTSMTLMGLVDSPPARISAASVFYRGEDLGAISAARRRQINGHRIAMIFQDPLAHLNPVYTIGWQIAEVYRWHPDAVAVGDIHAKVVELLRRVGLSDPEQAASRYPHQFSGGQRQRIMIAMALALRPEVLIADEPTTALDVTVQAEILKLIKELQQEQNMALLLITHDLGVAANMADRAVVMLKGKVVEAGPVREIFTAPRHDYTRSLLAARPLAGAPIRELPPGSKVALKVKGLTKHYAMSRGLFRGQRNFVAVNDVSFSIRQGETLAVVGESGSGKSTIARMIMRIGDATAGSAKFEGRDIFALKGQELLALRRDVQMIFQDPYSSLNPSMRIADIVGEPWLIHRDIVPAQSRRARLAELMEQVGLLEEHLDRYPHEFSGGQRQRIAIARALAVEPKLIICDEAVSALDVSVQAQVTSLLRRLQDDLGLSYLFISHDLEVVRQIAHSVMVMQAGEMVEQGPTAQIFDAPKHPYTRKLLGATLGLPWEHETQANT